MSSFLQGSGPSGAPAPPATDDFVVRIPRDGRKKITMMKFGTGAPIDFSKMGEQSIKIERENNFKEYKSANDLETMPKFGAGSEYGRDLKEESRRKKYGIMLKRYSPEDQPWTLKVGSGKNTKKYKGVREGSILENTSYYVFTKAADGAFEAFPVEEWYNFNPIIRYKYLNSDEAEEEFNRRDKTLNLFTIMLKKRYTKDEDKDEDEDEDVKKKGGKKSKKKAKNLKLTDMEDWDDLEMSDDEDASDDAGDDDGAISKKKKKIGKKASKKAGRAKNAKLNSDDEAIEESDEGDYEDREVDYMSDSGDSSDHSDAEEKAKKASNYDDKGVDQEAGLRNILDSDAEDEDEEEETQKDEPEEEIPDKEVKADKKGKGADDSSSSSSDDDSDIEKDAKLASELLGNKKVKKEKKEKTEPDPVPVPMLPKPVSSSSNGDANKDKGIKRKIEKSADVKPPSVKKHRADDSAEAQIEDDLRKYLTRKPMTTKDLLQKFRTKKLSMTNEKLQQVIAQLLKKINPDRNTINKKLYLSLKKSD